MRVGLAAAVALAAVFAAGCGGDTTGDTTAAPGTESSGGTTETTAGETTDTTGPDPGTEGVPDYSHEAGDLVAVLDSGGGFVPVEFIKSDYAEISVYGDGTVIGRDPMTGLPVAGAIARAELDALIADLAAAGFFEPITGSCDNTQIADAGTTTITVLVAGGDASVTCYGLEFSIAEGQPVPEPIRVAFERLTSIVPADAAPYVPAEVAVFATELSEPVTIDEPVVFPLDIDFTEAAGDTGLVLSGEDAATAWQFFAARSAFAGVAVEHGDTLYSLTARPVLPGQG